MKLQNLLLLYFQITSWSLFPVPVLSKPAPSQEQAQQALRVLSDWKSIEAGDPKIQQLVTSLKKSGVVFQDDTAKTLAQIFRNAFGRTAHYLFGLPESCK